MIGLLGLSADVARALFVTTQITNAAREGGLFAGQHYNDFQLSGGYTTAAQYKAAVTSAITNEEITPLLGCPVLGRTITFTPDIGSASNIYPPTPVPPGGPAASAPIDMVVQVDCKVTPLMVFLGEPNPLKLSAKVTTHLFEEVVK